MELVGYEDVETRSPTSFSLWVVHYAQKYNLKKENDETMGRDFYSYSNFGYGHRIPNGTIIRESLKMVSRLAAQVANECTLSVYCDELFKDKKGSY